MAIASFRVRDCYTMIPESFGEGLSTQQEEAKSLPDYPDHVRNQPKPLTD